MARRGAGDLLLHERVRDCAVGRPEGERSPRPGSRTDRVRTRRERGRRHRGPRPARGRRQVPVPQGRTARPRRSRPRGGDVFDPSAASRVTESDALAGLDPRWRLRRGRRRCSRTSPRSTCSRRRSRGTRATTNQQATTDQSQSEASRRSSDWSRSESGSPTWTRTVGPPHLPSPRIRTARTAGTFSWRWDPSTSRRRRGW